MTEHHPEEEDAPYADLLGGFDSRLPYGEDTRDLLVSPDFGETAPMRLHGCPSCGEVEVLFTASKCDRCGAEFTPASELPPRFD